MTVFLLVLERCTVPVQCCYARDSKQPSSVVSSACRSGEREGTVTVDTGDTAAGRPRSGPV